MEISNFFELNGKVAVVNMKRAAKWSYKRNIDKKERKQPDLHSYVLMAANFEHQSAMVKSIQNDIDELFADFFGKNDIESYILVKKETKRTESSSDEKREDVKIYGNIYKHVKKSMADYSNTNPLFNKYVGYNAKTKDFKDEFLEKVNAIDNSSFQDEYKKMLEEKNLNSLLD